MSTAILTPETDAPETTEKVTFMSRSENQVLTRKKTRHVLDANGERRVQTEADWRTEMQAASEKLVREGKEPLDYDRSPWKIQFELNRFVTDDPVLIDWLRGHEKLDYNGPSGFYEVRDPVDVDQLEPKAIDQLRALQNALMTHDLSAAEAVLTVEHETHNRPQVLEAAASAVESLRELLAEAGLDADPEGKAPSPSSS